MRIGFGTPVSSVTAGVPMSTSPATRSGCASANESVHSPPIELPTSSARGTASASKSERMNAAP